MSHYLYHIRITIHADTPEKYKTYFEQKTVKYILVQENPDEDCKQVHLHAMFTCLHKNDQAVRRELKKWFPEFKGNEAYSVKEGTIKGWNYVCKGPNSIIKTFPIVVSTTETNEQIIEWHEEYWQHRIDNAPIKSDVIVVLDDEPIVKKKIRTQTWTEKLIEQLNTELTYGEVKYADVFSETYTMHNYVMDKVLDAMGPSGKALDDLILIRLVNAVINGIIHGQERIAWKASLKTRVLKKMINP